MSYNSENTVSIRRLQLSLGYALIMNGLASKNKKLNFVTNEKSIVKFLNPNHKILNYPNKISLNDFDNWVQERGLYFPNEWGKEFSSVLSMNDINEDEKKGSLLVAYYGKGTFIYTGLSFFRQLPNGIPGAYKLFVNLISHKR